MQPNRIQDVAEIVGGQASPLDLSQLLGFRDLEGIGASEGEMAAALDAAHVKIGESLPPSPVTDL